MSRASMTRAALVLLPMQAVLRGGEALLPLFLAAWFGRGAATDLYYVLAAYFVFTAAILTGAFQDSAVVPVLIEVEAADPGAFPQVAGALLGHTMALGAVVALALGTPAAAIAALTSSTPRLAVELVALMALGTVTISVRAYYVGLLNARRAFTAHPVGGGLGTMLAFAILYATKGPLGVLSIPLGTAAGELLAIAVLAAIVRRGLGLRLKPTLARPEPVRRIFKLVRLEVTGSLITRVNPVVDQLLSGLARVVGGGTLVRYATDVSSLPTSVLQATLLPVLLTRLAQEARDPDDFCRTLRRTLAVVVALLAVASAAMIALRRPLCTLLFLHGQMDPAGVERIAAILPWALVGVAPFGALLVLARAHVALQNSRIMPSMGVLNAGLNAALDVLLVGPLGLPGIALSTSITYLVVAVVFWVRLPRSTRA